MAWLLLHSHLSLVICHLRVVGGGGHEVGPGFEVVELGVEFPRGEAELVAEGVQRLVEHEVGEGEVAEGFRERVRMEVEGLGDGGFEALAEGADAAGDRAGVAVGEGGDLAGGVVAGEGEVQEALVVGGEELGAAEDLGDGRRREAEGAVGLMHEFGAEAERHGRPAFPPAATPPCRLAGCLSPVEPPQWTS
jgi:hypothetical protein